MADEALREIARRFGMIADIQYLHVPRITTENHSFRINTKRRGRSMADETLIEIARRFGIEPSEYDRTISIAAAIYDGTHPHDLPGQMIKYMSRHECSQNMKLAIAFNIGLLVGSGCRRQERNQDG